MSRRITNAGAEPQPTCPARGSSGCKASRVDCCSDAVRWTAVVTQSGHAAAYPDSNIRRHIEVSRSRIWLVSIDRRSPVDGDAAENEAEKDRHIQPVTPAHQEMVLLGHEHAGLFQQRARRVRFISRSC